MKISLKSQVRTVKRITQHVSQMTKTQWPDACLNVFYNVCLESCLVQFLGTLLETRPTNWTHNLIREKICSCLLWVCCWLFSVYFMKYPWWLLNVPVFLSQHCLKMMIKIFFFFLNIRIFNVCLYLQDKLEF